MNSQEKAIEAKQAYQKAEFQMVELQQGYSVIVTSSDAEGVNEEGMEGSES